MTWWLNSKTHSSLAPCHLWPYYHLPSLLPSERPGKPALVSILPCVFAPIHPSSALRLEIIFITPLVCLLIASGLDLTLCSRTFSTLSRLSINLSMFQLQLCSSSTLPFMHILCISASVTLFLLSFQKVPSLLSPIQIYSKSQILITHQLRRTLLLIAAIISHQCFLSSDNFSTLSYLHILACS